MATQGDRVSNETLLYMLQDLKQKLEESVEERKESFTELKDTLETHKQAHLELKEEIQNYKIRGETTARLFKWLITLIIALATLKLGDVKSIWLSLFGK